MWRGAASASGRSRELNINAIAIYISLAKLNALALAVKLILEHTRGGVAQILEQASQFALLRGALLFARDLKKEDGQITSTMRGCSNAPLKIPAWVFPHATPLTAFIMPGGPHTMILNLPASA